MEILFVDTWTQANREWGRNSDKLKFWKICKAACFRFSLLIHSLLYSKGNLCISVHKDRSQKWLDCSRSDEKDIFWLNIIVQREITMIGISKTHWKFVLFYSNILYYCTKYCTPLNCGWRRLDLHSSFLYVNCPKYRTELQNMGCCTSSFLIFWMTD